MEKVSYENTGFINGQRIVELEYIKDSDNKLAAVNVVWEHENGDKLTENDIKKPSERFDQIIAYFETQIQNKAVTSQDVSEKTDQSSSE